MSSPVEQCKCGRDKAKRHCPACGSLTIYNLASKTDLVTVGEGASARQFEFKVYRCRRCGGVSNAYTMETACEAPFFETKSMKEKRLADSLREAAAIALAPENREETLRRLFPKKEEIVDDPRLKL